MKAVILLNEETEKLTSKYNLNPQPAVKNRGQNPTENLLNGNKIFLCTRQIMYNSRSIVSNSKLSVP
jgi:hypothetical protein